MAAKSPRLVYIKNEAGEFVCPECAVTKKNQNTMHYHMLRHTDVLPNTCEFCQKSFLQKQQLDLHLKTNAGKGTHPAADMVLYECPFDGCDFESPSKGNCRTHCMRIHVGEEVGKILERDAEKKISCKVCSNSFKSLTAFYYHSYSCVHLDEKDSRHLLLAQFA